MSEGKGLCDSIYDEITVLIHTKFFRKYSVSISVYVFQPAGLEPRRIVPPLVVLLA